MESSRGSVTAHRYVASPIEPRAYAANYEPFGDLLTVWSSTQNPHPLRVFLAASLGMGENQVRVIQPHVGGGFGEKVPPFPEEIVIGYAARSIRRPLKWIEERTEHFFWRVGMRARLVLISKRVTKKVRTGYYSNSYDVCRRRGCFHAGRVGYGLCRGILRADGVQDSKLPCGTIRGHH